MSLCANRLLTAALVGGLTSGMASAADYWVGPGGADRQQGGSQTRPWSSLQFAANRVKPGDTVHVLDGDYAGFDLRKGGNQAAPICFVAAGKNVKITRHNRRTPDGINLEGAGYVVVDGFRVDKMPRAGVRAVLSAHVTIRRVCAHRNGSWGIFTAFCVDLSLIDNVVSNSVKEHGIYVSNSGDRPLIRGNIASQNRGCGIHMNGDLGSGGDGIISGAVVENNVIFGNGRGGGSGINADGVQDSSFQNNLLYGNHANGISLFRDCGAKGSTGNLVVNNTIVMPSDGRWAINIQSASTSSKIFNNILLNACPSRGSINISGDSMPGFQSDHNLVVDRFSVEEDSSAIDLARWQSRTSQDLHSRIALPGDLFVDEGSKNYHLRGHSSAIDSANPALAPRLDIEGRLRKSAKDERSSGILPDIGAYEYTRQG